MIQLGLWGTYLCYFQMFSTYPRRSFTPVIPIHTAVIQTHVAIPIRCWSEWNVWWNLDVHPCFVPVAMTTHSHGSVLTHVLPEPINNRFYWSSLKILFHVYAWGCRMWVVGVACAVTRRQILYETFLRAALFAQHWQSAAAEVRWQTPERGHSAEWAAHPRGKSGRDYAYLDALTVADICNAELPCGDRADMEE